MEVYQSTHKLFVELKKNIENLDKEYKYTIGEKIKEKSFDILLLISKIKNTDDKTNYINRAINDTEDIRLSVKFLKDSDVLNDEEFMQLSQYIQDVAILFDKMRNNP